MNNYANRHRAAALLIALLLLAPLVAAGEQQMTVFAVTSTGSGGPGTLEAAIVSANALPAGSGFQIAIEVDGALPTATALDLSGKSGWLKSRPDATIDGFSCDIRSGGALTLEDAVIDNSASDLPVIRVSDSNAGNALLLKGVSRITGSGSSNIYVAGTLEIDRAPLTSDADGALTLNGTNVGIAVIAPGVLRMRGGTLESNGTVYGIMGSVSVASGELIANGGSCGINCLNEAERLSVYGGTVVARAGGAGPDIEARHSPLFAGGSIDARSIELRPVDEAGRPLYLVTATVGAPPVSDGSVFCRVNGALSFPARTDAEGKLYLWMPAGEGAVEVSHDWKIYRASGTVEENDDNRMLALADPVVTAVAVSPASAKANRGASVQFTAVVEGEPLPPQGVTWAVENGHAGTFISDAGLLTISESETARTLLVTATSDYDPSQSGTAVVTVAALSAAAIILIAVILLLLLLAFLLIAFRCPAD